MTSTERVGILLDGEFIKKTLGKRLRRFPSVDDVLAEVERMRAHQALNDHSLYRIFYYTADPLSGKARHPLDGTDLDFGNTPAFSRNRQLIDKIENAPDVAVRRGTLAHQGWEISSTAVRELTSGLKRKLEPKDVIPKIQQKGVDMRIGLDIASLAIKRLVSSIVIATGDSDLVPAMKLARREGLRVYLDTLGTRRVRPELKVHADRIL